MSLWAFHFWWLQTQWYFWNFQRKFFNLLFTYIKTTKAYKTQLWGKPNQLLKWLWGWKCQPRKKNRPLGRYKKQLRGVRSKAKTSVLNYIWCNSTHKHAKTTEKKTDEKRIPYGREWYLNKHSSKYPHHHFPTANNPLKEISPIRDNLIKALPRHFSCAGFLVLPRDPHICCTNTTTWRKTGT